MVDRQYSDAVLAGLYDHFERRTGNHDFDFYLPLVLAGHAVLDVGCGTGVLLRRAREAGHTGRLCGLDPADAMLRQARRRSDIEWVLGDLASVAWDREFDLVVMTGHAFQVLISDEELGTTLGAVRAALTAGGRFAFETRNPPFQAWESWLPDNAVEVTDLNGALVRMAHQVETPVHGDIVRFTTTFTSPEWDGPQTSRSTLRFLATDALAGFLSAAGMRIEEQFGDWTGGPLTDTSPEIITIATRVGEVSRGR